MLLVSHRFPGKQAGTAKGAVKAMWHVVFAESGRLPQSRAARSRDGAIKAACELLANSYDALSSKGNW
jgi:hypothetical protein